MKHDTTSMQSLYALVPSIECKGFCHVQCTLAPSNDAEDEAMREIAGEGRHSKANPLQCRYLTRGKRCKVYAARPLLCRLYGVAEGLDCPHGCKAERILTRQEASTLLEQAYNDDNEPNVHVQGDVASIVEDQLKDKR